MRKIGSKNYHNDLQRIFFLVRDTNLFYCVNLLGLVFDEYCTSNNNNNIKNKLHADSIAFVMAVCSSIDFLLPTINFRNLTIKRFM